MKNLVYMLFIDLAEGFDHMNRGLIFKTVCRILIFTSNTKFIQLMESLYFHAATALTQTSGGDFELSLGIREGGPESPPLFNLFMNSGM